MWACIIASVVSLYSRDVYEFAFDHGAWRNFCRLAMHFDIKSSFRRHDGVQD